MAARHPGPDEPGAPVEPGPHGAPEPRAVHATCVVLSGRGVLLRGPSGGGKSDLALRLLDRGARLVADDQTLLSVERNGLIARAPANTKGLLEVRGVGLITVPALSCAAIDLVLDLVPPEQLQRMPDPAATTRLLGVCVPCWALDPFESSAPHKVALIVGRSPLGYLSTWLGTGSAVGVAEPLPDA
ncbi:MAG: HPr kinase/phosphorylase [Alphaproteobacteria bacterium]